MSLDVQLIAFSEKAANEWWKNAGVFSFLSIFEHLKIHGGTGSLQAEDLIEIDLLAGGIYGDVEEGKRFSGNIELLAKTFISDLLVEKGWNAMPEENQTDEHGFYSTLFKYLSIEKIQDKFHDKRIADSLITLYHDVQPAILALSDDKYVLYININDELFSSPYFIDRAIRHKDIFQMLYTKWEGMQTVKVSEPFEESLDTMPSIDQPPLL